MPSGQTFRNEEVLGRIERARTDLGESVVILGHHYQADEVIRFADYVGDSLELSRVAASCGEADYIVFCGVGFMAESAALLCDESQTVLVPSAEARCPMAAMADVGTAGVAWGKLTGMWPDDVMPITYQNSSAELKGFCGERGGAVCTSANADAVFRWALERKGHVLFFPDEHLGRNTALAVDVQPEEVAVWDPARPGEDLNTWNAKRMVVWRGYCHVHTFFTEEQIARARAKYPGATVIVHPECPVAVASTADGAGSTGYIVRAVEESLPGSTFVIGTEVNLVERLARQHPDKTVVPLGRSVCDAMGKVNPLNLLDVLEGLRDGHVGQPVRVGREVAGAARAALDRMLEVT